MKKLSIFLLLLLPAVAYSQTENYKLDSYVNPDYKRKELDFNLGSSLDIYSQKTKYGGITNVNSKYQFLSGELKTMFNQVANSTKKQTSSIFGLNLLGNYLENEFEDKNSKEFRFQIFYQQTGYYYGKDKRFIEFSPDVNFYHHSTDKENKHQGTPDKEVLNSIGTRLSFNLGIGKGRIEQVGDAYSAMYILSDLKKNGSLNKSLNPDEVNRLAQQITSIKNKRQFDSRIKLIEEITVVDSFLTANGYTGTGKTAPHFTSLYDNWMYAGLFERKAGSRFSVGVSPSHNWNRYKTEYEPENRNNQTDYYSETRAAAYVLYEYEKPANLYLQHSVFAEIKGEWTKFRSRNSAFGPHFLGEYKLGYFPNTRTHIQSSFYVDYFSMINDENSNNSIISGLILNMYYYLSPQLRLSADSRLYFFYNKQKDKINDANYFSNNPNFTFNIGLQYSIF